ncbi:MAG: hypothetical protein ACYCXA_10365 [Actinomycetes bacterium]
MHVAAGILLAGLDQIDGPQPNGPSGPGFIGMGIFVLLALAIFFLWRSMNRQFRRVSTDLPGREPNPASPAARMRAIAATTERPLPGDGPHRPARRADRLEDHRLGA